MGGPFVLGSHHIARVMADQGRHVLHASRPFTLPEVIHLGRPAHRNRASICLQGTVDRNPRLREMVPFTPVPLRMATRIYAWTQRNPATLTLPRLGRAARRFLTDAIDLVIVDEPRYAGLHKRLEPGVLLYRATDLMSEIIGDPRIGEMEAVMCREADGLVATSRPVLDELQAHAPRKPSLLLENGVQFDHFARPAPVPEEYGTIPEPRAVYVGAMGARFDAEAVHHLAKADAEIQVVLIGPTTDRERDQLGNMETVHLLGPRAYEDLPGYLQHADVGLIPMSDHPSNQGRSPMKLYEYAAAGLPVLSRGLDEIKRRDEPFCYFYDSPAEMTEAAQEMTRSSPDREAIREAARPQSWTKKVSELLAFAADLRGETT